MTHIEQLTKYCGHFVAELFRSGVKDVVISPGSRSTPLALTICEHEHMQEWIAVDERSAAYFALGIAKKTKAPVALLCTSGTAAVNYFPAIAEAKQSRIPLIVLTTDRPHELRDIGAPQAIDQIKLFHDYVKWFHEMALPEASDSMLKYAQNKAARAINEAMIGNKGPVHLNFPFREPLVPDFSIEGFWGEEKEEPRSVVLDGEKQLSQAQLHKLNEIFKDKKRPVIVCGPELAVEEARAIAALGKAWQIPVLADPLSNVRTGSHHKEAVIEMYDTIFRKRELRQHLQSDCIIRFGAMPVSKMFLFYVQEHEQVEQFIIEENSGYRDPLNSDAQFINANIERFCEQVSAFTLQNLEDAWLTNWRRFNGAVQKEAATLSTEQLTEGLAVKTTLDMLPEEAELFVGNSMAIRDVDSFLQASQKNITVYGNRGTSGIDGVTSSAIGVAAKSEAATTLIIGDLSFYHDMTGLHLAMQNNISLTVILINNNGGGIFSFLPQSKEEKHFDKLYGTPLNIDFKHIVQMYKGAYYLAKSHEELTHALTETRQKQGLCVIEIQTERKENKLWHDAYWEKVASELQSMIEGENR